MSDDIVHDLMYDDDLKRFDDVNVVSLSFAVHVSF
jgi:hypothetical protein